MRCQISLGTHDDLVSAKRMADILQRKQLAVDVASIFIDMVLSQCRTVLS